MSLYLGENCISAGGSSAFRNTNIGEIIQSTIPLTDAGLHLLDGSLINGSGAYADFVTYMADLYSSTPVSRYEPNVKIVGTLTNNNNVLSGFSASNYATFPSTFNPSNNTWEYVIKIKLDSIPNYNALIDNPTNYGGFKLWLASGELVLSLSSNGTSWDISNEIRGATLSANTDYWLKTIFDGSKYVVSYSTDGENYIDSITVTSSTPIIGTSLQRLGVNQNTAYPLPGSIDLNESYININGSRWWTGTEEIKPIFCTETQWQQSVTDYGVCGKFVYDSVNNTIRLPKITGFTEGTIDPTTLGDLTQAGLPNITGKTSNTFLRTNATSIEATISGCITGTYNASDTLYGTSGNKTLRNIGVDASLSSPIYGNSSTVQPQSIKVLYYIVIATSTKTEIEVDIDEVMTDLNGKADISLLNGKADTDLSNVLSNIDYVVESKTPTSADPSWYRVYKSGWVEQGGTLNKQTIAAGYHADQTLVFPKQMADTNYTITFGAVDGNSRFQSVTIAKTTTGGTVSQMDRAGSGSGQIQFSWHASGQGAQQ